MREVDRVQREVHLVFQARIDVDRGVRVERRTQIVGHVRDEHLADAPLGTPTGASPRTSFERNA